jgi:hypothetical protein
MNMAAVKQYAKIPESFRQDHIQWAILEHDPDDTGGYFVYLHESLDMPPIFDEWYENKDLAESSVLLNWGIEAESWKSFR